MLVHQCYTGVFAVHVYVQKIRQYSMEVPIYVEQADEQTADV